MGRADPPEFVFALKASRYLTHVKRLAALERASSATTRSIEPLVGTPKLGPDRLAATRQLPPRRRAARRRPRALPPGPALLRVPPPELVRG